MSKHRVVPKPFPADNKCFFQGTRLKTSLWKQIMTSLLLRQIEKMGADLKTTMEKVKEGIWTISCISKAQSVEEESEELE